MTVNPVHGPGLGTADPAGPHGGLAPDQGPPSVRSPEPGAPSAEPSAGLPPAGGPPPSGGSTRSSADEPDRRRRPFDTGSGNPAASRPVVGGRQPEDGNQILGRRILADVRAEYEQYREAIAASGRRVAIIRFAAADDDPPAWQARMEASRISAEQKVRNLSFLGFQVDHIVLPGDVSEAEFAALIDQINANPDNAATVVQFPPPPELRQFVQRIQPDRDIDSLVDDGSGDRACATAEGIWRVVEPFIEDRPTVAVVGAQGFVGHGVTALLRQHGIEPIELDQGDDLTQVRNADIVISVTGQAGILGPEHIGPHHRLVIDSGFVPSPDGGVQGDIRTDARDLPQNVTPVPGGIGPVEMAILLERAVRAVVDPDVPPWRFAGAPDDQYPATTGSPEPPASGPAPAGATHSRVAQPSPSAGQPQLPADPPPPGSPPAPGSGVTPAGTGGAAEPGSVPPAHASAVAQPVSCDPSTLERAQLLNNLDPTPRPGETPPDAATRVDRARSELEMREIVATYERLGDVPPTLDLSANDNQYATNGAHTIERHGPQIPLDRNPSVRTIEGRIYGDPPWPGPENWSYRWSDPATMNRTVNNLIRENWETIRSDLAMYGRFRGAFDFGRVIGEGYFNSGMHGTGPRQATYAPTAFVQLTLRLVPGSDPPEMFIVTAYPSGVV